MNRPAPDGGGGGGGYVVDSGRLSAVTAGLRASGDTFDGCATSMPSTGATGEAEVLIAAILADFSDSAVDILSEVELLSTSADDCNVAYADADSEAAARFLVDGGSADE